MESQDVHLNGIVVRDLACTVSNYRRALHTGHCTALRVHPALETCSSWPCTSTTRAALPKLLVALPAWHPHGCAGGLGIGRPVRVPPARGVARQPRMPQPTHATVATPGRLQVNAEPVGLPAGAGQGRHRKRGHARHHPAASRHRRPERRHRLGRLYQVGCPAPPRPATPCMCWRLVAAGPAAQGTRRVHAPGCGWCLPADCWLQPVKCRPVAQAQPDAGTQCLLAAARRTAGRPTQRVPGAYQSAAVHRTMHGLAGTLSQMQRTPVAHLWWAAWHPDPRTHASPARLLRGAPR